MMSSNMIRSQKQKLNQEQVETRFTDVKNCHPKTTKMLSDKTILLWNSTSQSFKKIVLFRTQKHLDEKLQNKHCDCC